MKRDNHFKPYERIGTAETYRRSDKVIINGREYLAHEYQIVRDGNIIAHVPMQHYKDARVKYKRMAGQLKVIERMKG